MVNMYINLVLCEIPPPYLLSDEGLLLLLGVFVLTGRLDVGGDINHNRCRMNVILMARASG